MTLAGNEEGSASTLPSAGGEATTNFSRAFSDHNQAFHRETVPYTVQAATQRCHFHS